MATVSRRPAPKVIGMACRQFLCTQRRLAASKGTHVVTFKAEGKLKQEDVIAFFKKCDELTCQVSPPANGRFHAFLTKR